MMKRGLSLFFVFMLLVSAMFVVAQEDNFVVDQGVEASEVVEEEDEEEIVEEEIEEDDLSDIDERDIEKELGDGGSVNGLDRFFDGIFQDDLENMRERFAEARDSALNGDPEEASELLRYYNEVADNLENEVSPDQKEEAVRLSRIIRRAIRDLRDQIPEEERRDFDDASDRAERVGTAAEIANQIRDLCNQLHNQGAWDQFEQVCKTDDEGPRWQRDYFDDLSDEQKEEAENFVDGIGACMRDPSSSDCDCEVANEEFKLICEEIVEAEQACRDGNEDACEVADRAGGDVYESLKDLPHLRRALEKLDQNFEDSHEERFDNHIPQVCRDAHEKGEIDLFGPDGREECFPLAVRERAPQPCIDALDSGELPDNDEFGFRSGCEDIMRKQGFDDPGEFDGEGEGPRDHAPALGERCHGIEDKDDKLKCFEEEFSKSREHFDERRDERREHFEDRRNDFRDFKEHCPLDEREACLDNGGRWDCRNGFVECFEGEFEDHDRRDPRDFEDHDRRERRDIGRDRFRDFDPRDLTEEERNRFEAEFGDRDFDPEDDFRDFKDWHEGDSDGELGSFGPGDSGDHDDGPEGDSDDSERDSGGHDDGNDEGSDNGGDSGAHEGGGEDPN